MSGLRLPAAALAGVGIATMVALTGGRAWPFGLAWLAAALVVGLLVRSVTARAALASVLVAACFVLTWEGGLFMLPAAACLLVDGLARRPGEGRRRAA